MLETVREMSGEMFVFISSIKVFPNILKKNLVESMLCP